jgi:Na+/H+ antiporter NhaD/arsenite permease-like protein
MQEILALGLFIVVLAFIAFELAHRTVLALLGAAILVAFGVLGQERAASEFVDWNTIGLLAGMMVIVAILEKTGVFEYLAIKSAQWGKARPGRILIFLSLVTAFLSAFLDNVTTVILMVPVTFLIADALDTSPIPFLLTQVMASNVGGTATLIGDPPNILIGSAADLFFIDFVLNLTPVVLLTMPVVLGMLYLMFRKELSESKDDAREVIANMEAAVPLHRAGCLRELRHEARHLHRSDSFDLGLEEHVARLVLGILHDVGDRVDRADRDPASSRMWKTSSDLCRLVQSSISSSSSSAAA